MHSKQIFLCTENFERFLAGNKVGLTSKCPNSSDPYAMKVECLKSDFCAPKVWKKWKKEGARVKGQKTVFGAKSNGLQVFYFLFLFLSGCLC